MRTVSFQPRCPHCRHFLYLDTLVCPNCEAELGFHMLSRQFYGLRNNRVVIDERTLVHLLEPLLGVQLARAR